MKSNAITIKGGIIDQNTRCVNTAVRKDNFKIEVRYSVKCGELFVICMDEMNLKKTHEFHMKFKSSRTENIQVHSERYSQQ